MPSSPSLNAVYSSLPNDDGSPRGNNASTPTISHSPASSSSSIETSLRALEVSDGPITHSSRMRSNTVSSFGGGLDFRPELMLLPLTLSSEADDDGVGIGVGEGRRRERRGNLMKTVGLVNGIALVVGSQVGSGIFSSPGVVLAETKSVGASLIVWVVSGVLAWTGASSFAELGSMIPISGGPQAYLAYAYNPLVSFLYSWTAITALKPGGGAIIALIFGEYVMRLFYSADVHPADIPQWQIKLAACASMLITFVLVVAHPKMGTKAAVFLTVLKVAALVAVAVLGIIQVVRGRTSSSFQGNIFSGTSTNPSSYALALYSGLWAYDGWDAINFVTGEMHNPEKTVPRVIHSSMALVITAFLGANLSYFAVLDKSTVAKSNTVALDFGRAIFGAVGGIVFSVTVAVSCLGALQGGLFTASRLVFAAGQEGNLPAFFGRTNERLGTPVNAVSLHSVLTMVFIIVGGGFKSLVNFYSVASWGFYFLTVSGLILLRIKEPGLERPYKTFITTPLIFSCVALFLLLMPIVAAPLEALAALGFILVGIPLYYVSRTRDERDGTSMGMRVKNFFGEFEMTRAVMWGLTFWWAMQIT
ncbi:hypothetical protein FRC03_010615 [Tulasnella sp. 419]|nr:hypothetical protein FRC03_010615 [Tulasnella sp. 419]